MRFVVGALALVALAGILGLGLYCALYLVRTGQWQVAACCVLAALAASLIYLESER